MKCRAGEGGAEMLNQSVELFEFHGGARGLRRCLARLYSTHHEQARAVGGSQRLVLLCSVALDEQTKALGINPACSACVVFLAKAVAFDRAFFDEFV